jgi:hypothetical protein
MDVFSKILDSMSLVSNPAAIPKFVNDCFFGKAGDIIESIAYFDILMILL